MNEASGIRRARWIAVVIRECLAQVKGRAMIYPHRIGASMGRRCRHVSTTRVVLSAGVSLLSLVACVPPTTNREPKSCPVMAVPLSAALVTFSDSAVLERPELGTRYRFRGEEGIGLGGLLVDVFIYPGAGWSPPA